MCLGNYLPPMYCHYCSCTSENVVIFMKDEITNNYAILLSNSFSHPTYTLFIPHSFLYSSHQNIFFPLIIIIIIHYLLLLLLLLSSPLSLFVLHHQAASKYNPHPRCVTTFPLRYHHYLHHHHYYRHSS